MAQYRVVGNWNTLQSIRLVNDDNETLVITWESSDLEETGSGRVYRDGAHRVSSVDGRGRSVERAQVFKGDWGYSQAENEFSDRKRRALNGGFSST